MVTYNQLANGITKYIDQEIINKIQGWQRWALGAGAGIMMNKGTNMFNAFKAHPVVKMLEVIDDNGMIDIDTIYTELRKQAEKGSATFDAPMIGTITLTKDDVDKLYRLIKEG
jgi:hypothetical protein